LINDTTGTLIASSYVNPKTKIAVIFGTGCNAAYMERVGDIPKMKNLGIDDEAQMAINCEWVSHMYTARYPVSQRKARERSTRSLMSISPGRNMTPS
jgi:hexokinase